MSHRYVWEGKGLHRYFSGEISGDEILESNFELHEHSKFEEIKYIINDFLEVTGYDIKMSHTKSYASSDSIISRTKGLLYIAIVVNQSGLHELAKNYQQQMKDQMFKCEIFDNVTDAQHWVASRID